jgi:hypothetical protein
VKEFDKLPWQHLMFFEREEAEDNAGTAAKAATRER